MSLCHLGLIFSFPGVKGSRSLIFLPKMTLLLDMPVARSSLFLYNSWMAKNL